LNLFKFMMFLNSSGEIVSMVYLIFFDDMINVLEGEYNASIL
jgi:hypothetical protein